MGEKKKSDFRYATGDAAVPWAAIGEHVWHEDLMNMVRLLVKPGADQAGFDGAMSSVEEALAELCAAGQPVSKLSLGDTVKQLEAEFADYLGCKHASFLTNATAGFQMAHQFADLGPGDEVITTAISWIATSEVITQAGARVAFVDIDPEYYTLDVARIEEKITLRTKAIIPVHLYGQPAEMDKLVALCKKHGLYLIED